MIACVDLLAEWQIDGCKDAMEFAMDEGVKVSYPAAATSQGWYPIGFERGHDAAFDAMGWEGLQLIIHADSEETEIKVQAHLAGHPSIIATAALVGSGRHEVKIRLSDFELEAAKNNIWRFITGFECQGNAKLCAMRLQRGDTIAVQADVLGQAGEVNDEITYRFCVANCTANKQQVVVKQLFEGWESLIAEVTPARFVLLPGGEQEVIAKVRIHDAMVAGGQECTRLGVIANGDGSTAVQVEFKTLRRLPHPYIYHNTDQWEATRDKIMRYPKFKAGYDQIIADAEIWEVKPPVPLNERDYCYETREEHFIMSAAYAYALTKERKYADKVAAFLKYFTDEETGYPKKKKGCSQSYVQEGHFFQHLAIPYDIIYDAGVLTEEDHAAVERTFRIYMDILDHHIQSGHISNWLLSEIAGAVYCALTLQDMERVYRFVFGPGGMIKHLQYGTFNDGWWHECSVGYNVWVSSMFIHLGHALLPFGINILHSHYPIPFNREVSSTYKARPVPVRFGMFNQKWGGNSKNYICIKDLFDATIPFLDYRGVLFGISDSDEKKLEGVHFGSTFDLAYHYYKDPEYISVIERSSYDDPIFGHGELPPHKSRYSKNNAYADNIGIAMIRSQTPNREQSDQIQAVLRYGSHGYAHGHFDRTNMLSVMRYGRSFYNPEHVWWGYGHFMYKFYVQNSITKNMVVVDEKLQVPSDSKRTLFYSGKAIQAVAIETTCQWSYPPYGGMVYREDEILAERCKLNASSLPHIDNSPGYGELSDFTEPIRQKRVMSVLDDYIVLFDYLEGDTKHQFDSLFQIKGFQELKAEQIRLLKHTSQWTENPLSDGQFITDCNWHEISGTSVARFSTVFGEGEDLRGTRSFHNTEGILKMDVYTAWPKQTTQIIGRAAEDHGYMIPISYRVQADGETKASGELGAWLLGEGKCDIDVSGANQLQLRVKNNPVYNEQMYPLQTKQGLFWGEAYLVLHDGTTLNLSQLDLTYDNVDQGCGIGKDYEGGRVTIVGMTYPEALPASPVDHAQESVISLDLTGLGAVRFVGLIGADAFPGDEGQRRTTYAVRTFGKIARFTTIIEPYEDKSMIESVSGVEADSVIVKLKDGRKQVITVQNMGQDDQSVQVEEYQEGELIRRETAVGK